MITLLNNFRTQWQDKNIFMISVVWHRHALPIYWNVLEKKGALGCF